MAESDSNRFPDPGGLVRELDEMGVKLVTILDPGIKLDANYAVYASGRDDDLMPCTGPATTRRGGST